jgi:hypothetical protein
MARYGTDLAPSRLTPCGAEEERLRTILIIDQDRATAHHFALACLKRGIGTALVETVCEGVRLLLTESVSLIVVEPSLLRLSARDQAVLFDRVAPGVPVVIAAPPTASLEARVGWELVGFAVVPRPVDVEDVLKITAR